MKKIIKYLTIVFLIAVSMTGCELKETIYGTISDNSFWKTEEQIKEGINSAYGRLNTRFNGFSIWQFVIEDGGSDYNCSTSPYPEFYSYNNWSSTSPDAINWGIYKFFWNEISYLNKTIDMIPEADMSDELKYKYTCEARALRAFIYFSLVQWFNDVPLITSSKEIRFSIPKTPASKIYEFITKEYQESLEGIPNKDQLIASGTQDYGRLTKGAVMGLLARAYLVQKKYDDCAEICKKIITEQDKYGKYALMGVYKDIFKKNGFENNEIMWALAGDGVNNGMMLQVYLYKLFDVAGDSFIRDKSYDSYSKWNGTIGVNAAFYNSFPTNDLRKSTCLQYNPRCHVDRVMVLKYPASSPDNQFSSTDFPMLRYADIYLMYAESLLLGSSANISEAVNWVNLVRNRAGVTEDYLAGNFATPDDFKMNIYKERRWEFFMEGCAKRDMMRFGTLLDHIKAVSPDAGTTPERYFYLPFPSTALAANPELVQNPGYLK